MRGRGCLAKLQPDLRNESAEASLHSPQAVDGDAVVDDGALLQVGMRKQDRSSNLLSELGSEPKDCVEHLSKPRRGREEDGRSADGRHPDRLSGGQPVVAPDRAVEPAEVRRQAARDSRLRPEAGTARIIHGHENGGRHRFRKLSLPGMVDADVVLASPLMRMGASRDRRG